MRGSRPLTCLVAGLAAATLAAFPTAAGQATVSTGPRLDSVVVDRLLDRAAELPEFASIDAGDTRISITRTADGWAFGTAVLVAPMLDGAYPEGWLFLARAGTTWDVAFEGEPAFAALSATAPMLSSDERALFSDRDAREQYAGGDYRTGMRLPFATSQSWTMSGGPHGSPVWDAIDLHGGDQVVRAARAGTAYTMCRGWLRVVHDRGYATDYYHLWNNIWVDGAQVSAGARLGDTGTDVTCGGSATGRHVHFGLRQNGAAVPIAYHIIGKWVIMPGSAAYQGYALHGSTRVNVGRALYNYGPLGFTQGIVDTNGGTVLNKRSGPGTGYAVVGTVADAATISVSCSQNGTSHTGRWGTSRLWNRLTDGTWVSDAFVATGLNGPLNGWC